MISIVIPTFNEAKEIRTTLRNLSELRHRGFEIILSDALSTDRTVELAKPFADKVVLETDPGLRTIARGRNLGAAAAEGEYLVFIDADIFIPHPLEFFRRAQADFEQNPKLVGLTVKLRVHPAEATWADRLVFGWVNFSHWLNNLIGLGSASGEFQMIRTAVFRKIGGFQEKLAVAEDIVMFRNLAKLGQTRLDRSLTVFHHGRRAHAIGWPRTLWAWARNWLAVTFLHRSADKEWTAIR